MPSPFEAAALPPRRSGTRLLARSCAGCITAIDGTPAALWGGSEERREEEIETTTIDGTPAALWGAWSRCAQPLV